MRYRGREVLTNPPPSAGGILLAYALALLDREPGPPDALALVRAMEAIQAARDEAFFAGLPDPGFARRFLSSRVGSTTHVSVLDAAGWACSVTTSNGEGSGVLVPGTGLHLNNMLGEQDLSPLGFFAAPPGSRLPSAMAPTLVRRDGELELVLGSAGSNRIRSALLQVIVNTVDLGLPVAGGGRRARGCTPRTAWSRSSRASTRPRWPRPGTRSTGSAPATRTSAAARRSPAWAA